MPVDFLHRQTFDVLVEKSDYNIKKLIMMQKQETRAAGLSPAKFVHVDSKEVFWKILGLFFEKKRQSFSIQKY